MNLDIVDSEQKSLRGILNPSCTNSHAGTWEQENRLECRGEAFFVSD